MICGPVNRCVELASIPEETRNFPYVVCSTPRNLSQLLWRAQFFLKTITFILGACILPIRAVGMREGFLELVDQSLIRVERPQHLFTTLAPIDTSMLLTSTGDSLDSFKGTVFLFETLKDEVNSFNPHSNWSVDFSLGFLDMNTLFDAIFGEIGVKVCFSFTDYLKIRSYDNCL